MLDLDLLSLLTINQTLRLDKKSGLDQGGGYGAQSPRPWFSKIYGFQDKLSLPGQIPVYAHGWPGQIPVYTPGGPGQIPVYAPGRPGQIPVYAPDRPGQIPVYALDKIQDVYRGGLIMKSIFNLKEQD